MVLSVEVASPCLGCFWCPAGTLCRPQQRVRCSRFLDYIQQLHRARAHHLLIQELKMLISKGGE